MIVQWFKALAVAFIFLTRIPMPQLSEITPQDNGRALVCFPIVGLVIGLLLWVTVLALDSLLDPGLIAALILSLWVFVTGGLHLDGLADSADAWLGGYGDKERSLEIMKDPRCGSAALMTVPCLLLLKFAALSSLLTSTTPLTGILVGLALTPVIGRSASIALFLSTPYVREQGLSRDFDQHAPKPLLWSLLVGVVIIVPIAVGMNAGLLLMVISALLFWGLRHLMISRLGGCTGDTAGACVEIIEAGCLVGLCLSLN